MASPIIPKSKIRKINNISVGFGEVPAVTDEEGRDGWGLPGKTFTTDENEAKGMASELDVVIRSAMQRSPRTSLLH